MMPGSRSSDPDPVWIRIRSDSELLDPDPAGTRMYRSGLDPDPAGSKMSRSGLDPDPAGSENCGSGAPLFLFTVLAYCCRPSRGIYLSYANAITVAYPKETVVMYLF